MRFRATRLPEGATWPMVFGAAILCGVGFMMALFIASLGLEGAEREAAKAGILGVSGIVLALGLAVWALALRRKP